MTRAIAFLSIYLALAATALAASPPDTVNYQGVLRSAAGVPENGPRDVLFRFYDAASGGSEILIDEHAAAGTGAVTATDGLFNVALGTGAVSDGAGPGLYSTLAALFGDFTDVWMQIEIDGEVLSPRVRVSAAPYAQNAARLDGVSSGQLLRSDTSGTIAGDLTVTGILDTGSDALVSRLAVRNEALWMNDDGPDGDSTIFFFNNGSSTGEFLRWDDAADEFVLSEDVSVHRLRSRGDIFVNQDGPDGASRIYFFDDGSSFGEFLLWSDGTDEFQISNDLEVFGDLDLSRGYTGFTASGFSLVADDFQTAYFGSRVGGEPSLSSYIALIPNSSAQIVGEADVRLFTERFGVGNVLSAEFDSDQIDFYIEGSQAARISSAENLSVYGSNIILGRNGPDRDQDLEFYEAGVVEGERLQWDDSEDRFEFSDDLHVFGNTSASGTKNFVQNHPYDPSLEIVYTSLEGNEATVFTRGSARLEGGIAMIELDESFALVTNPELGLSAHLTPRGDYAELYVTSLTTDTLEVRGVSGGDVAFDYIVYGLRIGYEDFPVIREKQAEAHVPTAGHHDAFYAERPGLRRHAAIERYREVERRVHGRVIDAMPRAAALRAAIGEREPGLDIGAGKTVPLVEQQRLAGDVADRDRKPVETVARPVGAAEARIDGSAAGGPAGAIPVDSRVGSSGRTAEDVRARSFQPSATDLASMHAADQPLEPGDVVVLSAAGDGSVHLSKFAAEKTVFGVVASDPGLVLGAGGDGASIAVATSGVVNCRVDASYGAIRPGDLLVTSPTPGHAMRASDAATGTILGKAVGGLDSETGLIRIVVSLR